MNAVVFCDVLCVLRMSCDCLCCSYVWLQSASDEEVNLSSCVHVAHHSSCVRSAPSFITAFRFKLSCSRLGLGPPLLVAAARNYRLVVVHR